MHDAQQAWLKWAYETFFFRPKNDCMILHAICNRLEINHLICMKNWNATHHQKNCSFTTTWLILISWIAQKILLFGKYKTILITFLVYFSLILHRKQISFRATWLIPISWIAQKNLFLCVSNIKGFWWLDVSISSFFWSTHKKVDSYRFVYIQGNVIMNGAPEIPEHRNNKEVEEWKNNTNQMKIK